MRGRIKEWARNLGSDEAEIEADALCAETDACGAIRADRCAAGEKVEVLGKLRTVQLPPHDSLAALIAELYDGTDSIELIWLGRRSIAGIVAGRTLRAKGRIAIRDGHKAIYNPSYRLLPTGPQ